MQNQSQVTVTGGSGFVATYCMKRLLEEGYSVKTTIRSLSKENEIRNVLNSQIQFEPKRIQFFEADLLSDKNWDEAVKGSEFVLHVASPFFSHLPKNADEELYKPAVQGALRALEFSLRHGVKRVVMTSSQAAISYGHTHPKNISLLDENTWTDVNGKDTTPYIISKTLSEKAAWEFMETQAKGRMEFTTINPSAILGPVLSQDFSASIMIIKKILDRDMPALPRIGFQIVDVRDVAEAHIRAMKLPEASGKRIGVTDRFVWFSEIATILHEEFSPKGYKIPKVVLPDFLIKVFALFDKETRSVLNELGMQREFSNERMKNVLKIQPISAKEAILATAKSLISLGMVK